MFQVSSKNLVPERRHGIPKSMNKVNIGTIYKKNGNTHMDAIWVAKNGDREWTISFGINREHL